MVGRKAAYASTRVCQDRLPMTWTSAHKKSAHELLNHGESTVTPAESTSRARLRTLSITTPGRRRAEV